MQVSTLTFLWQGGWHKRAVEQRTSILGTPYFDCWCAKQLVPDNWHLCQPCALPPHNATCRFCVNQRAFTLVHLYSANIMRVTLRRPPLLPSVLLRRCRPLRFQLRHLHRVAVEDASCFPDPLVQQLNCYFVALS